MIWRKIKLLLPDENLHSLGTRRESCKNRAHFRRVGVKEPRHSETVLAEKKVYLYRGTRLAQKSLFEKSEKGNPTSRSVAFVYEVQPPIGRTHSLRFKKKKSSNNRGNKNAIILPILRYGAPRRLENTFRQKEVYHISLSQNASNVHGVTRVVASTAVVSFVARAESVGTLRAFGVHISFR